MAVVPYKNSTKNKKKQVAEMFDNISARYDLLNHVLSLNIDKYWRKKSLKLLAASQPKNILDVATGTADFAIAALKLHPEKIVGIDISDGMLAIGRKKLLKKKLQNQVELLNADSENMPFADGQFDAVTCGFGVRNFENLGKGINEIYRVLSPQGVCAVLEFSKPQKAPFKQLYQFYFKHILPKIGKLVSKDASAYTYLPDSVDAFPSGAGFEQVLKNAGFDETAHFPLTFGIATIYMGKKAKV